MHVFVSRLLALLVGFGLALPVIAQEPPLERPDTLRVNMQNNLSIRGHFAVGPTRFLLRMQPGETRTVELQITNRKGERGEFHVETQDFTADERGSPIFYGSDRAGPYPARLWIRPETSRFDLVHGERAFLRIDVTVPSDAEPGDHQAAIVIRDALEQEDAGGVRVTSSVASLFIITVEGDLIEEGQLLDLSPTQRVYWSLPAELALTARNDGTVHLIPSGVIELRNLFGIVVDEIRVEDWVILRNSTRTREFPWHPRFALGFYRATTDLVLTSAVGETMTSPVSTSFWVIPALPVLIALLLIFLVSFLIQFFFSRFEFKRKDSSDEPIEEKGGKRKK